MKTTTYDGSVSRRVLAGMVTDRAVLARIAARWTRDGLFAGRAENLVGGWCVGHHRKYGGPPGKEIQTRFDSWARSMAARDEKLVERVGAILQAVSDDWACDGDGRGSEYVLDLAGALFSEAALRVGLEEIQGRLDLGDVAGAVGRWAETRRVDLGVGALVRPGQDWEPWRRAFDPERADPLFEYPGALGRFIGPSFARDCFVAVQAPAKRLKSWVLLDLAHRAVRARRRVAYFEAGDLSEPQVLLRLGQAALRRPLAERSGEAEVDVEVPVEFADKEQKPRTELRRLRTVTAEECFRAWRRATNERDRLRLSCHPNSSLTAEALAGALTDWAGGGWVADVVVVDYADILAAPPGVRDAREGINETWKRLRRLSQELHCLVLTATQADAASYDQHLQRRKNFSEDRRKHDHVTTMFALNMTDDEKGFGVMRVNILDRRSGLFVERRQCWVVGCPAIGCPVMLSTM